MLDRFVFFFFAGEKSTLNFNDEEITSEFYFNQLISYRQNCE